MTSSWRKGKWKFYQHFWPFLSCFFLDLAFGLCKPLIAFRSFDSVGPDSFCFFFFCWGVAVWSYLCHHLAVVSPNVTASVWKQKGLCFKTTSSLPPQTDQKDDEPQSSTWFLLKGLKMWGPILAAHYITIIHLNLRLWQGIGIFKSYLGDSGLQSRLQPTVVELVWLV